MVLPFVGVCYRQYKGENTADEWSERVQFGPYLTAEGQPIDGVTGNDLWLAQRDVIVHDQELKHRLFSTLHMLSDDLNNC